MAENHDKTTFLLGISPLFFNWAGFLRPSIFTLGILFFLLACTTTAQGQLIMVNKADTVSVVGDDFISVIGGVWNDASGAFYNEGKIYITDSLINDGQNSMFHDSWQGMVELNGADQLIGGNSVTKFYDLQLTGTGIKRQEINALVEDSLILNDLELATDSFSTFVLNPDTGIVTRMEGFVSSLDTGYLARRTNLTLPYLFPTGSSLGTPRYRPVVLRPNTTDSGQYSVRMANVDATVEGYDRSLKESLLCEVNPFFYHRINTQFGPETDINIYYDESNDGYFSTIVHWQTIPQWEDIGPTPLQPNVDPPFSILTKESWSDFNLLPFALSNPIPEVWLESSADTICQGDSITITAVNGGLPWFDFILDDTDTLLSGSGTVLVTNTLPPGSHEIHVVNSTLTCIHESPPITVFIVPAVVADAGRDTTICSGNPVTLGGNPTASSGLGNYLYSWEPAHVLDQPHVANPTQVLYNNFEFILVVQDTFGCPGQDTMRVEVIPTPMVDAGKNQFFCDQYETQLDGHISSDSSGGALNPNSINILWTPSPLLNDPTLLDPIATLDTSTLFTLIVDNQGCTNSDSVWIDIYPDLNAFAWADTSTICSADSVLLHAQAGIAVPFYEWTPAQILTSPRDSLTWAFPDTTTTFMVAFYEGHCFDTAYVTVEVLKTPEMDYYSSVDSGCKELEVNFLDMSLDPLAFWTWDFGDGTDPSNEQNPSHIYYHPGTYQVSLEGISPNTCEASISSMNITVWDTAVVDFTTTPDYPTNIFLDNQEVWFYDASDPVDNWLWTFGDGDTADVQNPVHIYADSGAYMVSLTLVNEHGCTSRVERGPFIVADPDLLIPNVFSPNGDQINDYFNVVYNGNQPFKIDIFDRWGLHIFDSRFPFQPWNGKIPGGQDAPAGVYYYIIHIGTEKYKGNLTLLR